MRGDSNGRNENFNICTNPDPFYSKENMRVLEQSARELREGRTVTKTMDELRAMEVFCNDPSKRA